MASGVKKMAKKKRDIAPISKFWVVRWSPTQDAFDVEQLSRAVDYAQECFHECKFSDYLVLSVHPNKITAVDETQIWQKTRNKRKFSAAQRLLAVWPHVKGLVDIAQTESF